jgi:hypothetical protein
LNPKPATNAAAPVPPAILAHPGRLAIFFIFSEVD